MELFFLLLLLQTNLLLSAAQFYSYCYNNGNYTSNSTYADNLNTALSSLATNIGIDGFYNASVGSGAPDTANAIALCRGDVRLDECRGCVRNATGELGARCPSQRQAVKWNDYCILRYSNATLLGIMDTSEYDTAADYQNATNSTQFSTELGSLLDNLRNQAINGGPTRKVAAANTTVSDFQYIFAMVQCSPDLSSDACESCLIIAAQQIDLSNDVCRNCMNSSAEQIPGSCNLSIGCRFMYPSCGFQYETYPFYNQTRLLELDRVLSPPSATEPASCN